MGSILCCGGDDKSYNNPNYSEKEDYGHLAYEESVRILKQPIDIKEEVIKIHNYSSMH